MRIEFDNEFGKIILDSENPRMYEFSDNGKDWHAYRLVGVSVTNTHQYLANTGHWRYCRPIPEKKTRPMNFDEVCALVKQGAVFVEKNGVCIFNPSVYQYSTGVIVGPSLLDKLDRYRFPGSETLHPLTVTE